MHGAYGGGQTNVLEAVKDDEQIADTSNEKVYKETVETVAPHLTHPPLAPRPPRPPLPPRLPRVQPDPHVRRPAFLDRKARDHSAAGVCEACFSTCVFCCSGCSVALLTCVNMCLTSAGR